MDIYIKHGAVLLLEIIVLSCVALCTCMSAQRTVDEKTRSSVSAGHICIETRAETFLENTTVPDTCLERHVVECGFFWASRNCSQLREVDCNRTVSIPVTRNVTRYVCCTGWARDEQHRCLIPVCKEGCQNDGRCIEKGGKPVCRCQLGYTGSACQEDIDECQIQNICDHKCINTKGSYICRCKDDYSLKPDGKTCHPISGSTRGPLSGYLAKPRKKEGVNAEVVYLLVVIGIISFLILVISIIYLVIKRKKRLAMEAILEQRVKFSPNVYNNPEFSRSTVSIVENLNMNDAHREPRPILNTRLAETSNLNRNIQINRGDSVNTHTGSNLNSTDTRESVASNESTGWTNPMFLNALEPQNGRPATYAIIDEDDYSGSNVSNIYQSISERFQTLEGFDVGESNDYDSFSDEYEQEHEPAEYANSSIMAPKMAQLRSVYLHTPCQSMQSLSSFPNEEEHNYESVSDTYNGEKQSTIDDYDYVTSDDNISKNRDSSTSSYLGRVSDPKDDGFYEDTSSPDITREETQLGDTQSLGENGELHNYEVVTNSKENDYYEDGESVLVQSNTLIEDYDFVSDSQIPEPIDLNRDAAIGERHHSVQDDYSGPTIYYDDAVFLARKETFDCCNDPELQEYEYMSNSKSKDKICDSIEHSLNLDEDYESVRDPGSEYRSRISQSSFKPSVRDSKTSVISSGITESANVEIDDYDEIGSESANDSDSDYEKVSNIGEMEIEQENRISQGSTKNWDNSSVHSEPLYDDVYIESGQRAIYNM